MDLELLLKHSIESEFLDYKEKVNFKNNKVDFLRDIIAFANVDSSRDKYIIYGVKESKDGHIFVGLSDFDIGDPSIYQNLINEKIEPYINIEFLKGEFENKKYIILVIKADKDKRPYIVSKAYENNNIILQKGESWIRIGSSKDRLIRRNYENIYNDRRGPLEIQLNDTMLFVDNAGLANLELLLTNISIFNRVFNYTFFSIEDENENQLTVIKMISCTSNGNTQKGSFTTDFVLNIPSKSEMHGVGIFPFSTSQAVLVGLDIYGEGTHKYIFKLKLRHGIDKEYLYTYYDCDIYAKEDVLRKVIGIEKSKNK